MLTRIEVSDMSTENMLSTVEDSNKIKARDFA